MGAAANVRSKQFARYPVRIDASNVLLNPGWKPRFGGTRFGAVVCILGLLAGTGSAYAQQAGQWRLTKARDGLVRASLFSTNTQSAGSSVIDYHPLLILSCKPNRQRIWRQAVILRAQTSGRGTVSVTLRLDGATAFQEKWVADENNTVLYQDGADEMARLARANVFRISWSNGVFSGRGLAIFSLDGIKAALSKVAESCGIAPPFPVADAN